MQMNDKFPSIGVLGSQVSILTLEDAVSVIRGFIEEPHGECHHVVATGFHGLWEAHRDPSLFHILNSADLWVPDGIAPVLMARLRGIKAARRITGADLMHAVLRSADEKGYRSFFYGDTAETLGRLSENLRTRYRRHIIAGTLSPPFRPLTPEEDDEIVCTINEAKPQIVWVGLGMPKQDAWIFSHKCRLNARVAIGVGAAFRFLAGMVRRVPQVVGDLGFEWAWRLAMEPRKLWKRDFVDGPQFLLHVMLELAGIRKYDHATKATRIEGERLT
jgi:N-acetylglucosaminyldiphosphoundecaprenol N-acetyl-beta-D-mannosaminyltransferase